MKKHWLGILMMAAIGLPGQGWGEARTGGAESMDRPSARPLPESDYAPVGPPQGFQLPRLPQAAPETAGDGRKFWVQRIVLEGNTVFSEQTLRPLLQAYEGRYCTITEMEELRQKLTRYYIGQGYINSGAVISSEPLKAGALRLQIIEGRLNAVRVKGQGGLRESYIASRLLGDAEQPFKLQDLQDRFQLLLSDPLISRMNGRILPGAALGQGMLEVDVTRARPYRLSLFGNNYRPPSIGAEAFGLSGTLFNLTSLGDQLDFTFIDSAGSSRYSGGFALPVTDRGTQLFFRFDEGDSMVLEESLRKIGIQSKVHNLEGGISHPLLDEFKQRLNLGLSLAIRSNQTDIAALQEAGKCFAFSRVRSGCNQATVLRLFQDYMRRWNRHALAFRSTFSVGLDLLGATPQREKYLQDGEFFAWLGQAQYAFRVLDNGAQLVLRGALQLSNDPLLPLEQIAVGGVNSVRGYRENFLVRDQGYSLSMEFHYPLLAGSDSKRSQRLSLIPFLDYGEAWNHRSFYNRQDTRDALFSVGLGLNWQLEPVTAEFYYGYALKNRSARPKGDLQDDGVHFQVRLDVF
jgi:hemolysin activation/secretion protein